jgi:hypothetical protein
MSVASRLSGSFEMRLSENSVSGSGAAERLVPTSLLVILLELLDFFFDGRCFVDLLAEAGFVGVWFALLLGSSAILSLSSIS